MKYNMTEEEKKYLSQYDIAKYERPSVAADMAVFSIMGNRAEVEEEKNRSAQNYRKMPEKKLKILLIRRASHPFKDCWALPGGFCRKGEDIKETARRELYEETNVKDAYLQLVGTFGEPGRDPRGWIISHTFMALMDGKKCRLRAGSDAWEAQWFEIQFDKKEVEKKLEEDSAVIINEYHLQLLYEDIRLQAIVQESKRFEEFHEDTEYEIKKSEGIAFDHAELITCALINLRQQVEQDGKIMFDLMPETFTLTELQRAFEITLNRSLTMPNFRRKMADYVVETEQIVGGAGHRPAKKYKRNLESFYQQ